MKQHKNSLFLLAASFFMLNPTLLHAATPTFSIVPTTDAVTSILLPSNFIETVSYTVTNNTKISRTLTMVPMTGVTQGGIDLKRLSISNSCLNPFTLAPQQSCTLRLTVHGNEIPSTGIRGGPVICKTIGSGNNNPDPSLCSQPNQANLLTVSVTTPGQHAYVADQLDDALSVCQVNPATGFLSQCRTQATGLVGVEGVGFNPARTLFYTANLSGNNISVCQYNSSTGAISDCADAGGSGFAQPDAVAFSPDGNYFYTANAGGGVTACLVDATTGHLSGCVNNSSVTFSAASDMTLNSTGTLAFVSNRGSSNVSVCNVSGLTVDSCFTTGSVMNQPEGITLSPSGLFAYITNAGDGTVTSCSVTQSGSLAGSLVSCATTGGEFHGTGNLAFDSIPAYAFVPNQLLGKIFVCQVTNVLGTLSGCVSSPNETFIGPSGIAIQ